MTIKLVTTKILPLILPAFILSGCLTLESQATVNPDGTGKIVFNVTLEDETVENANQFYGILPLEQGSDLQERILNTATDLFSEENGYTNISISKPENLVGVNVTADFSSYTVLSKTFADSQQNFFSEFFITETDDGWLLQADPTSTEPLASTPEGESFEGIPNVIFSFTMPGSVVETTSNSVNGSTVSWNIFKDKPEKMTAVWTNSAPISPLQTILLFTLTILAVVALVVMVKKRKDSHR